MTNEEIEIIKIVFQSYLNIVQLYNKPNSEEVITEVRDKLIKELEQQPCDDCISRQAVLDTIGSVPDYDDGMVWEALSHAQRDVALLSPVTPQTDILDKIRAEIENHCGLAKENHCKYCSYCNSVMGVREILKVIDEYKAEGSEK